MHVKAVAFGLIKTRLTDAQAGTGAAVEIERRKIKVGVISDLMTAMENPLPLVAPAL
jgi:3-oxoacyl-[acyl-carrier protein] reductase